MLSGWRGAPGVDVDALAELAAALSRIAAADPAISIECNPVMGYPQGYGIADLRAILTSADDAG